MADDGRVYFVGVSWLGVPVTFRWGTVTKAGGGGLTVSIAGG